MRARFIVCVCLFSLITLWEFPPQETTTQPQLSHCASPTIPMKNTSLWFFGQCQRTPSADPAERKIAVGYRPPRGTGGVVWRPLALVIVSYWVTLNRRCIVRKLLAREFSTMWRLLSVTPSEAENGQNFFSREKVADFFQWGKICSFSHFLWSNTQAGKAGEASQVSTVVLYILSVFLTADAPDICDPLVLYTKTDTKPIYLIFHVKQMLNVPIC